MGGGGARGRGDCGVGFVLASDIDIPDDLVQLERSAWKAAQKGELTAVQAGEVQAAITAFAETSGIDRYTVEMALKRIVRHPDGA